MSEPLRLLSIGAGAIGTYIGGSLALKGHQVVFVERPELADELRSRGLRLNISGTEHHLSSPQMVDSIEKALAIQEFDAALFALKSFDTPTFLASLNLSTATLPPFLCFSNGVDNEPVIATALGPDKVISGTVTTAILRRNSGEIVLEKLRGIGVALPEQGSPAAEAKLSERLVAAMDHAGLKAQLFTRAADMKWSKMLTNLIANATSAILDMPPGEIFAHPGLYRMEIGQLRETLRVMAAQGIRVVDLPGTPVRLLAVAVTYLPLPVSRPLLGKAVGGGRGGKMPSFHIDLHAGRGESEVDFLNGAVVRAGQRANIPTPVNSLLTETLLALTRGEIPMDHYRRQPDKLMKALGGDAVEGPKAPAKPSRVSKTPRNKSVA
jgi:2-dehydropantoate 2-reductase